MVESQIKIRNTCAVPESFIAAFNRWAALGGRSACQFGSTSDYKNAQIKAITLHLFQINLKTSTATEQHWLLALQMINCSSILRWNSHKVQIKETNWCCPTFKLMSSSTSYLVQLLAGFLWRNERFPWKKWYESCK